jgi:hypothetical protein
MKSNHLIKSTTSLRVDRPNRNIYVVWIQNYLGLVPPKLEYEADDQQGIRFTKVTGQIKGIAINSMIFCGIVLLTSLGIEQGNFEFQNQLPLLLGIIGFMTLMNFLVIESTKWKVNKQIKRQHANNA